MKTRFEPRIPRMSSGKREKVLNITPWIRTQAPCILSKDFVTRPSKLDTQYSHKAVHVKIPVEGTDLPKK